MKKALSVILSVAVLLMSVTFLLSFVKAEVTADGFVYAVHDDTAGIAKYVGSASELVIPSVIDGYTVNSIGESAFEGCDSLTSVTIPGTVISIYNKAFYNCRALERVMINDSVRMIGDAVFSNCRSLTNITIPDSVIEVGAGVFWDTPWFDDQPDGPIYAGKVFYQYKGDCPETVTLKQDTLSIADCAFKRSYYLESIVIPDSVIHLGISAFVNCSSLQSVTIGNSITTISSGAFKECTSLAKITIPDAVRYIEEGAFCKCKKLSSVSFGNSVTRIDSQAFFDCTALRTVTIPRSVSHIGEEAFGFYRYYDKDKNTYSVERIQGFTIRGYLGTEAENYATRSGLRFIAIEEKPSEKPTEVPTQVPTQAWTQAPTEVPAQPSTEPDVPVIVGDADGDSKVTILDATAIQRHLASLPTQSFNDSAADSDEDGKVTILDATAIQRWLAGLPTNGSIGSPIG